MPRSKSQGMGTGMQRREAGTERSLTKWIVDADGLFPFSLNGRKAWSRGLCLCLPTPEYDSEVKFVELPVCLPGLCNISILWQPLILKKLRRLSRDGEEHSTVKQKEERKLNQSRLGQASQFTAQSCDGRTCAFQVINIVSFLSKQCYLEGVWLSIF